MKDCSDYMMRLILGLTQEGLFWLLSAIVSSEVPAHKSFMKKKHKRKLKPVRDGWTCIYSNIGHEPLLNYIYIYIYGEYIILLPWKSTYVHIQSCKCDIMCDMLGYLLATTFCVLQHCCTYDGAVSAWGMSAD